MPNILMSIINDTRNTKDNEKVDKEKRLKLVEKKEKKFNKIISKAVGGNP